ncbi:MAG: PHP domain-containing protein [Candidatus Liptonbacteria bacterium]|nr:PHP domain-containing protein [Candidatus Liptonbacteria bacterium]
MVDFHMHSTYSDGSQSVRELIGQASENGVTMLSMTDHDTTAGISEAQKLGAEMGVKIIPGIEITTAKNNKGLHLLAYGIGEENKILSELLARLREGRKKGVIEKLEKINQNFKSSGRPQVDIDDVMKINKTLGLATVMDYLVANGFTAGRDEAYELVKGMKVRSDDVTTEYVIDIVHRGGGIVSLAHPFAPKISLRNISDNPADLRSLCKELKNAGLDGIEVYTPAHRNEDIAFAKEIVKEVGFFGGIGSDWHGPFESKGENIRAFIPRYPNNYKNAFDNVPTEAEQELVERFKNLAEK